MAPPLTAVAELAVPVNASAFLVEPELNEVVLTVEMVGQELARCGSGAQTLSGRPTSGPVRAEEGEASGCVSSSIVS